MNPAATPVALHLEALERELLSPQTRRSPHRLAELLHPAFREIGSSGRLFTRDSILHELASEPPAALDLLSFECTAIAPGAALCTYRSRRRTGTGDTTEALRSSLWLQTGNAWQLFFHQGTRTAPLPG